MVFEQPTRLKSGAFRPTSRELREQCLACFEPGREYCTRDIVLAVGHAPGKGEGDRVLDQLHELAREGLIGHPPSDKPGHHTWHLREGADVNLTDLILANEVQEISSYQEGDVQRILVNRYERDARARAACVAHYGTACHLCGIDFEIAYGPLMAGFIHVHHLKPLSAVGPAYTVDPIADLRPICPNCHAVIHRKDPPLTLEEVRVMLGRSLE